VSAVANWQERSAPRKARVFTILGWQFLKIPRFYRIEGREVSVSMRDGRKLIVEPVSFDVEAWLRALDRHRGDPIFPNGREQPPMQERDFSSFDE